MLTYSIIISHLKWMLTGLSLYYSPSFKFTMSLCLARYCFTVITNKAMHMLMGNIGFLKNRNRGNLLKFAHINVRGALSEKSAEIDLVLDGQKPHILGVSETNQIEDQIIQVNDKNYFFEPGFNYTKKKTRIGAYIHKSLNYKVRRDKMEKLQIPCVWLEVKLGVVKIAVLNIYREFKLYLTKKQKSQSNISATLPNQLVRFNNFIEAWESALDEYDEVWVLGDCNLDFSKIKRDKNSPKKHFIRLLEDRILCKGVKQLINGITWIKDNGLQKSCVDHIYTNCKSYSSVDIVNCLPSSDHNLVCAVRRSGADFLKSNKMLSRNFKNFFHSNYDFLLSLSEEDFESIKEFNDPEEQAIRLTALLNVSADQTCPIKVSVSRMYHTKWMNDEIRAKLNEKENLYKDYLSSLRFGDAFSIPAYAKYKKVKNWINKRIKKVKADFFTENINKNRCADSAKCWKLADETMGRNSTFHPAISILESDGNETSDPVKVANIFAEFFDKKVKNLAEQLPPFSPPPLRPWPNDVDKFSFQPITGPDIVDYINELSSSTAFGHDFLSNNMVRYSKFRISSVLADITNKCFRTGKFPEFWKHARVKPLHKKGNLNEVKNYRPVALLCSLSKIIERAAFKQIYWYLSENNFLDSRQYGFRPGHSTIHAVLDLVQVILEAKNTPSSQCKVNSLMFDLSAAFDLVDHNILIRKLANYGFGEDALCFIRSYLSDRTMAVQIGTSFSKEFPIRCGVPQGSVLGPLLYAVTISDIQSINEHPKILYADDTSCVIVARSSNELKVKSEAAINDLASYYHKARLKLNAEKTQIIHHDGKSTVVDLLVDAQNATYQSSVSHSRLLGIQIDTGLNFKAHINNLVRDVRNNIKMFKRLPEGINLKARRTLGIGLLISRISYAISIYSMASRTDLNRVRVVYHDALRAIWGKLDCGVRKIKLDRLHRGLDMLTFSGLIKYYDCVLLNDILTHRRPYHLYKLFKTDLDCHTRSRGNVKIFFKPKNEKSNRSFLIRSIRTYNSLPLEIRKLTGEKFKKTVRQHLFDKENQSFVSCAIN